MLQNPELSVTLPVLRNVRMYQNCGAALQILPTMYTACVQVATLH
jgi:hypothetical protein